MRTRTALLPLFLLALILPACASSTKVARPWSPGDTVICPHCGREFPLPEKLGGDEPARKSEPVGSSPTLPADRKHSH